MKNVSEQSHITSASGEILSQRWVHNQLLTLLQNEQLNVESNNFLLQCIKLRETEYSHFNKYRLIEKTMKLFDTIPKTTANIVIFDIKKETASFMRYIDCSRIRNYDIKNLLHYVLTTTSFFLTKDSYLWKPRKSDLATELKKLFEGRSPKSLPATLHDRVMIIDFTGYARKVPTNKANFPWFI